MITFAAILAFGAMRFVDTISTDFTRFCFKLDSKCNLATDIVDELRRFATHTPYTLGFFFEKYHIQAFVHFATNLHFVTSSMFTLDIVKETTNVS